MKDKTGIVRFNTYRGIFKPKTLIPEHPANKRFHDSIGKELNFLAVFRDDGQWCFFGNHDDGTSAHLGTVYHNDIEFIK